MAVLRTFSVCLLLVAAPGPDPLEARARTDAPGGPTRTKPGWTEPGWTGFLPRWEIGMKWDVDVRPALQQPNSPTPKKLAPKEGAGTPATRPVFPPPVRLSFEVLEIQERRSPDPENANPGHQRLFLIAVTSPPGPGQMVARLVYTGHVDASGNLSDLALARYQARRSTARGSTEVDIRPHAKARAPHPVLSSDPLLPFDFAFLSRDLSAASPNTEIARTFEVVEAGPEILYQADVLQRVRPAGSFLDVPPILAESGLDTDRALEYLFIRRPDLARSRQIWHPDHPWYLWSEGTNGEARLVLDGPILDGEERR